MIFYADDDADDLQFFTEIARGLGKETYTFQLGDELLTRLKSPPPFASMVFLDINMPRKTGIEVLETIRSQCDWNGIPIIMFSTSSHPDHIRRSFNLGADYFLVKPASYTALNRSLEHIFSKDFSVPPRSLEEFVYAV